MQLYGSFTDWQLVSLCTVQCRAMSTVSSMSSMSSVSSWCVQQLLCTVELCVSSCYQVTLFHLSAHISLRLTHSHHTKLQTLSTTTTLNQSIIRINLLHTKSTSAVACLHYPGQPDSQRVSVQFVSSRCLAGQLCLSVCLSVLLHTNYITLHYITDFLTWPK